MSIELIVASIKTIKDTFSQVLDVVKYPAAIPISITNVYNDHLQSACEEQDVKRWSGGHANV